jgi:DNA/RNA-binding domain of Phe-tRNA-synthetase-like protein
LRAFDAGTIDGDLCIRDSAPGESLAGGAEMAQGTLTIADEAGPAGLLFGAAAEGREVDNESRRIALVAIQVGGVPQIAVEEALWLAADALDG